MMHKQGVCALTGQQGQFVKCHLLPEALYPYRDHRLKVVDSDARSRPRRRPVGVYDDRLVTRAGEDILQGYDNYGVRFLRRQEGRWTFSANHSEWLVENFDYDLVRLFFLSVLWRCGVSSQFGQELIDISAHATELRDMVCNGDPGDPNTMPITAHKYDHDPKLVPVFPFKTLRDGNRTDHVALFGGFDIDIMEVSPQAGDPPERLRVLTPNEPWLIRQIAWRGSDRERIARASVDQNDQSWPGWMTEIPPSA